MIPQILDRTKSAQRNESDKLMKNRTPSKQPAMIQSDSGTIVKLSGLSA